MPRFADVSRLMPSPPGLAHGFEQLVKATQPAAGASFTRTIQNDAWERIRAITFQLVTSAAAGNRQVLLNYADGDGFIFDQTPASQIVGPSGTVTGFLSNRSPTAGPQLGSLQAEGAVTNPGLAGTIASIAAVPAGVWQAAVTVFLSGTVTVADQDNMALAFGGAANPVIAYPGVVNTPVTFTEVIELPAAHAVTVQAIAAASGVSAVYNAELVLTSSAGIAYYANIPDHVLKSGYQVQLTVNGIQAGDQLSGIGILTERFPSDYAVGGIEDEEHRMLRALWALVGGAR